MMAMIRENLELLCRGLTTSGATKITAERFRQAKFNKYEAIQSFWILLYEILHYTNHNEFPTKDVMETLAVQDVVLSVKHQLYCCGHRSTLLLNSTTVDNCVSRELLLAFGWMIAKYNIVNKLMTNCQLLADRFLNSLRNDNENISTVNQAAVSLENISDLRQCARYLMWLHGRLQLNLRGLYSVEVEKHNLSHHIHKSTQGVSISSLYPHLFAEETYLLRYPKQLNKFYDFIETENTKLQCLLKWKENEDVFWKWMESVTEAKFQDDQLQKQTTDGVACGGVTMTTDMISYQLMDLHSDLAVLLNGYHGNTTVERLAKKKITSLAKKHIMDYSVKEIEMDVIDNLDGYPRQPEEKSEWSCHVKYLLREKSSTPNKQKNFKDLEKQKSVGDVKTKIESMRKLRDQLAVQIETERNKHGQILTSLAEHLDNVVCIPPSSQMSMK